VGERNCGAIVHFHFDLTFVLVSRFFSSDRSASRRHGSAKYNLGSILIRLVPEAGLTNVPYLRRMDLYYLHEVLKWPRFAKDTSKCLHTRLLRALLNPVAILLYPVGQSLYPVARLPDRAHVSQGFNYSVISAQTKIMRHRASIFLAHSPFQKLKLFPFYYAVAHASRTTWPSTAGRPIRE
jgi:hypothetical protein